MPEGPIDPFAAPTEPDPFMPGDPGPVALADEIDGAADEIPTVDAEGNVIDSTGDGADSAAEEPQEPREPAQEPQEPAQEPQEPAEEPQEPAEAPQEPAEAPQQPAEANAIEAATPTPAAPPATRPPGPRGGKGEMRHYKLLYVSAEGQFTIADLSKVPDDSGITVVKLDKEPGEKDSKAVPGDVGELWFEARNNEHANRLGFTIMGRPKDGVHIFAVPRGAWKPRFVKPAPPQPARERVVIS